MTPAFALQAGGTDVTERVERHLVELRVTLSSDSASDTLQVTISDAPKALARPAAERELKVSLGYRETGLVPLGVYFHSETDVDFAPRRLVLRATAADFRRRSTLKAPKSRAWQATTLGAIVTDIATEHGYTPRVDPSLAAARLDHVDQTAESDMHLLRRLGRHHDATVKAAGGRLVMMPHGAGRSAVRGDALPVYRVTAGSADVLSGRVSWRGRPRYGSVQASYYDLGTGALEHVIAGEGPPTFVIRDPRPDRAQALADAQSRLARLARQTATLDLTLVGAPTLTAEGRMVTSGWGEGTDGTWSIERVTHILGRNGFHSQVSATIGSINRSL